VSCIFYVSVFGITYIFLFFHRRLRYTHIILFRRGYCNAGPVHAWHRRSGEAMSQRDESSDLFFIILYTYTILELTPKKMRFDVTAGHSSLSGAVANYYYYYYYRVYTAVRHSAVPAARREPRRSAHLTRPRRPNNILLRLLRLL